MKKGNVNDFLVSLGQWDLKATDAGEKIFAVEKALAHPNYTGDVSDGFDVGLLRLSSSIAFDRYIQPICVPRGDTEKGIKCQNAVVYGWGRLSTDGEIPSTLRKAEMTVTSQSKCKLKGIITDKQDRFVCAKGAGNDNSAICLGDSGGPLATVYNGVYYLTGVVSYLKKSCGLKGVPDVFSRTSAYAEWISANAK
ncbi:unnamed protein product [Darwinula stevensoni]|uniref:Peptidase S1 domain-containing protein n=1 Tax=Darwinula stevensoni TaxID=69355 RepID=A0A7R8X002_9CRUS|nr:unnamed protein product [Darwinula stevensoni]CAG0881161.1 unnamed protein product [Darwinula stevensoni]